MRENLDAKQGTWDPYKDIKAEVREVLVKRVLLRLLRMSCLWGMVLRSDVELLFSFFCLWDVFVCICDVCTRLLYFNVCFTSATTFSYFVCLKCSAQDLVLYNVHVGSCSRVAL